MYVYVSAFMCIRERSTCVERGEGLLCRNSGLGSGSDDVCGGQFFDQIVEGGVLAQHAHAARGALEVGSVHLEQTLLDALCDRARGGEEHLDRLESNRSK